MPPEGRFLQGVSQSFLGFTMGYPTNSGGAHSLLDDSLSFLAEKRKL